MIADIAGTLNDRSSIGSVLSLMPHVKQVGRTYNNYFESTLDALINPAYKAEYYPQILLPTQTTGRFVRTVKEVISPPDNEQTPIAPQPQDYPFQFSKALETVGKKHKIKWDGAWATLYSDSPDRLSQAAHSGRELLMQILADLAPDEMFSKEELARNGVKKPTKKMRITKLIEHHGESAVEWVNAISEGNEAAYKHLLKICHDRNPEPTTMQHQVAGLLMAFAGVILYIIGESKPTSAD
jgi:hypothetical protein